MTVSRRLLEFARSAFDPQETLVSWNAKLFPQVEGGLACL